MRSYLLPFTHYPFEGEEIPCPVCGSGRAEPIARLDRRLKRLRTSLCGDCGLFFTNPMPTDAELSSYYRDTYRFDYQFALFRPRARHVAKKEAEARRRYETIGKFSDLSRPIDFLDFGCGSGELVRYFGSQGHRAHGFEPGALYAGHAAGAGSVEIRNGAWADMDYAQEAFGLITCLHVLEHLREPVAALTRMAEWLKSDGLLYLEVPDMQGYALKGFEHFHFAHVLGFSSETLVLAAQKAGLGVLERLRPTSIVFSKGARRQEPDLAGTVTRNRREYGAGIGLGAYLAYHARRLAARARR